MEASASRTNLLMKCGFWARPAINGPPNPTSEYASYGIAVHTLAEHAGTGKPLDEQALATVTAGCATPDELESAKQDAQALHDWHTDHIGGEKHYEQKIAYNVETHTARVLQSVQPRDYTECVDSEFPGTADLIAVKPEAVCVIDFKTGHTPWEIYKDQLNLLGLAASKIYERSRVVCIVLKVAAGECYPHYWVLDQPALDDFESRFITARAAVPDSQPTPGPHCLNFYCPLAGTCPATLNKLEEVTGKDLKPTINTECSINDDEHANRLYEIKSLLTKTSKAVTLSLKQYVDQTGGFMLPNGKMYKKDKGSYKETRVSEADKDG